MKASPRTLAGALAVLTGLAASACEGRLAHHHDEKFARSYEVPPGTTKVVIEVVEGPVSIVSGPPGAVKIEASTRRAADTAEGLAALRAIDLQPEPEQPSPGVLALRGPSLPPQLLPQSHRLITKAVVEIPPELEVEVVTGFGPLSAVHRAAAVRLATLAGDVRLDGCSGEAVVRTGSGVVMVQHHRGGLDVESRECQTMQVFIDELGSAGVRLTTVKGGIQAHLPAGAAFSLDARTLRGKAVNSFGVAVEPIAGTEEGLAMRGAVGGGGPPVTILVSSGNVSVRARTRP